MVWHVVFRDRKPGVYELWGVCSEYVVDFSDVTFQSYSTRMHTDKAYQAFVEHVAEKGEHISNKWYWKDWMILVQFVVIDVLLFKIMQFVILWL
jgi:hypothetical protein